MNSELVSSSTNISPATNPFTYDPELDFERQGHLLLPRARLPRRGRRLPSNGLTTDWWTLIPDGTNQIVYDSLYNVTHTATNVQAWDPVFGGGAPDQLTVLFNDPFYTSNDAPYFPGRPGIFSNVAATGMVTSVGDTIVTQPYDLFLWAEVNLTATASDIIDGRLNPCRAWIQARTSPDLLFYAGNIVVYPVAATTLAFLLWFHWDGASSFMRRHLQDGTEQYTGLIDPGTQDGQGFTLFGSNGGGAAGTRVRTMGFSRVKNGTINDYNVLIAWAQAAFSWL